ncbi:unnamed protein product [Kuraishia capsulata CBS 1993]|uniref:Maintenance of telomere capping protein 1 n=1 Tax=Kuraishia capsulata CBS 1993 TaxID=1382522 RepID=W6MUT6_9ASCO|nr:uncharacterized protein KUCA_T00001881001 [Kuraishia capsulata CBS 1993]CDK25910.1 unnamed protein product [Kuraishia capsulata CBS 1993]
MSSSNKPSEADDVLEFLNSLPDSDKAKDGKTAAKKQDGKSDEDIFEFLDELAAEDKKEKSSPTPEPVIAPSVSKDETSEDVSSTQTTPEKTATVPAGDVSDPISSLTSWWSTSGSTRVGSQVSSLWGTAQSLKQSAQEKAEEAIRLAKEKGLEENVRKAFQEVGITGVREDGKPMTEEELLKLPDAHQALQSLNKGFGFFQNKLSGVIDKIQTDFENAIGPHDEVLDVKLVHDLRNYGMLNKYVTHNFESVMSAQVDGDIQVKVAESQTVSVKEEESDSRSLSLFQGKISDAEKLVFANIESVIKNSEETKENASETAPKKESRPIRKSNLFIGLQAVAVQPTTSSPSASDLITIDAYSAGSFSFTTVLKDTTHNITIVNRSQPFPLKWAKWLDDSEDKKEDQDSAVDSTDVDPSDWVIDWVNRGLDMTFGVLAQSYIIRRMGY